MTTIPHTLSLFRINTIIILLAALMLFASCNRETIFQSDFNATAINNPPATAQKTGTVAIDGPAGNVKVVASPVTTSDRFVQITRTNGQPSVTGLQCNFSKFIGNGTYHFSSALYILQGTGLATI